jgi:hypothetical protein
MSKLQPIPLKIEELKCTDTQNIYYLHRELLITWVNTPFKCLYCGLETKIKHSIGRMECRFHPTPSVYSRSDEGLIYPCCKRMHGSTGCVACDHTDTHFSVMYDDSIQQYPYYMDIPYAFWRTCLFDIPKKSIIKHNTVFVKRSRNTNVFSELECVNFWESTVRVKRYDAVSAIPGFKPAIEEHPPK